MKRKCPSHSRAQILQHVTWTFSLWRQSLLSCEILVLHILKKLLPVLCDLRVCRGDRPFFHVTLPWWISTLWGMPWPLSLGCSFAQYKRANGTTFFHSYKSLYFPVHDLLASLEINLELSPNLVIFILLDSGLKLWFGLIQLLKVYSSNGGMKRISGNISLPFFPSSAFSSPICQGQVYFCFAQVYIFWFRWITKETHVFFARAYFS